MYLLKVKVKLKSTVNLHPPVMSADKIRYESRPQLNGNFRSNRNDTRPRLSLEPGIRKLSFDHQRLLKFSFLPAQHKIAYIVCDGC